MFDYKIERKDGSYEVVNRDGVTKGTFATEEEALFHIEQLTLEDAILATAFQLAKTSVSVIMEMHHIEKRRACLWLHRALDLVE